MYKLLVVLATASMLLSCNTHAQTKYNFDFEQLDNATHMPTGWGLGNVRNAAIATDSSAAGYKVDASIKQHGNYSLLIDWTKQSADWTATNYAIKQTFAGKRIVLKGYIKTEGVTGTGAGLWMRIDGDNKTIAFDNMMTRAVTGTTDWKEYTVELEYDDEKAEKITIGGLIVGKGKMWMDNLSLTIDGKDIADAPVKQVVLTKADLYPIGKDGSGIKTISLDKEKIQELTNLGMVWGFIKYHHPAVASGDYNMDAQLFKILPKVLDAKSASDAYTMIEKWVDEFGKPDLCKNCDEIKKTDKVKLMPDYGYLFDKDNLPKSLTDKLDYILHNRNTQTKHYYIEMAPNVGNPDFKHEPTYEEQQYPDAGMRLLTLYRYWNMIQYFYPNRHLIGEGWNKVLTEFIPEFANAKDTLAYDIACLQLIGRIHDTHANVWGNAPALRKYKGELTMPLAADFIGDKLVVVDFFDNDKNSTGILQRGDVIEKIDGVTVNDLVKKYLPLTPASNYETQLRDLASFMSFIMRSNNTKAQLQINRGNKLVDVVINRMAMDKYYYKYEATISNTNYKIIGNNIGYIYPAKLKDGDINSIQESFKNTKGIVIDMRCYPSSFMPFVYGEWFKPWSGPFVRFTFGSITIPGMFTFSEPLENGADNTSYYKGKIVIIVNAKTQSQAEYTTMALCTAPNVTVIGSTTAGADGNVSDIILPGGIQTMISGIGILYPDGTESQRKGVKIDVVVKPTIQGIKDGKDELLDKAIEIINKG